jgi:hypothetical protein
MRRDMRATSALTVLLHRAKQAIGLLMECNGHTELTKTEFAGVLAERHGGAWMTAKGLPNRRLVDEVCALSKDQFLPDKKHVHDELAGYVIAYSPTIGGMTLIDATGEMALDHMLHLLAGDLLRQRNIVTMMRRRADVWHALAKQALAHGDIDLGLLAGQIENEINRTGYVGEGLAQEFIELVEVRGIA